MQAPITLQHFAAALTALALIACSQGPQKVEPGAPTSHNQAQNPSADSPTPTADQPTNVAANTEQDPMTTNPAQPNSLDQESVVGDYNALSAAEARVILSKGTDYPGDGGYTLTSDPGTYVCRQCNAQLYRADDKFESHCGWPSFDDEIDGAVTSVPDADGRRTEIICANCDGHLGHVFVGERMTPKNTRHCVNSSSMTFIAKGQPLPKRIVKPEQP